MTYSYFLTILAFDPGHYLWEPWQPWSACSKSCDVGNRERIRNCPAEALLANRPCSGSHLQTQNCYSQGCPRDGIWGLWSEWSLCGSPCGDFIGGKRHRRRSCLGQRFEGQNCTGQNHQSVNCSLKPCTQAFALIHESYDPELFLLNLNPDRESDLANLDPGIQLPKIPVDNDGSSFFIKDEKLFLPGNLESDVHGSKS